MIVVLLNSYIALLAIFVWMHLVRINLFWKLSPIFVLIVLLLGLFVPMGWGAPSGPVIVLRNSVQIIPSVSGEVMEVEATANTPLKAGDVLFRIDRIPYEANEAGIKAQLGLAQQRLAEVSQLQRSGTGRGFDVEQRQAEVNEFQAKLKDATYNLDKTIVRAPADGYVTNLALRRGARVNTQSPVMAFIDTSQTLLGAEIPQIYARFIEPGQRVEVTFKIFPGAIYTGTVETVIQAVSSGQTQLSGAALAPSNVEAMPFVVRIRLDDGDLNRKLPAGSTGLAAIYTEHIKPAHIIREVVLRQSAILNYVVPF